MNFKSTKDLAQDIKTLLLPKLPKDIGVVFGIPRSGMLPASIIATAIGADLAAVGEVPKVGARGTAFIGKGTKALLVDDSIFGGGALARSIPLMQGYDYLTCAIYAHPKATNNVDIYAQILDGPRFFEWNFTGIKATEGFMFDMDGVICTDPAVYDDDGVKYMTEIKAGVKPLFIPQVKIHSICTNRIERWRGVTEEWLKKHEVNYGKLIMQPHATAVERRKKSFTPAYKAENFNNSDATVFVESHKSQAIEIAKRTNKPVLCIETMELIKDTHACVLNSDKMGMCMVCGKKV
jgi:uncharacterized HAD superfamily protein